MRVDTKARTSFLQVLRDPSGNSFVESLVAPSKDPQLTVKAFTRSTEEDHTLGIYTQEELHEEKVREKKKLLTSINLLVHSRPQLMTTWTGWPRTRSCTSPPTAPNATLPQSPT